MMSPRTFVEQAFKQRLSLIAVCDHNSAEYAWAAVKAGRKVGVVVLPGMEITSREEVAVTGSDIRNF